MRRFGFVLLLVLTSCTPASSPTPAPSAGGTASRQSAAEAEATLASLRRVDDLPLYEMTYTGDYETAVSGPAPTAAAPFGCSLFAALGDRSHPVFGRNFDWDPNPALVLRADPPDGHASISLVDLRYLGFSAADDPRGDRRLLDAPLLPFDGLNERGLAVGMAADESARSVPDPSKPAVGSVRILRLVLDQAATVDEALAIFARHNLDFTGGPPLHYLLADASGASALVEYTDGQQRVERGTTPWRALTNVPLAGVGEEERRHDRRYRLLADALDASGGRMTEVGAMDLLRSVAQPHTRWSVTYDLATGQVRVVAGQRWQTVYSFRQPVG
ncbi:linear amide C-N hydrolase [Catellatospora aurea]|uniref:Linear amide C-N hydrolase n=1 Tax=Catellatospora aurea TaxID=1337874 RepID=A0ABW2GPU5_9ACTN